MLQSKCFIVNDYVPLICKVIIYGKTCEFKCIYSMNMLNFILILSLTAIKTSIDLFAKSLSMARPANSSVQEYYHPLNHCLIRLNIPTNTLLRLSMLSRVVTISLSISPFFPITLIRCSFASHPSYIYVIHTVQILGSVHPAVPKIQCYNILVQSPERHMGLCHH